MTELSKRQAEIVQISIKLISEGGIQLFTTKMLAKELGLSEPAIYRHFKNKMEILYTILILLKRGMNEFSDEVEKGNKSLELIHRMFNKLSKQFTENPALAAIIFSEEIFQNDKKLSELVSEMMEERHMLIQKILLSEQQAGIIRNDIPAEQLTTIIIGAIRLNVSRWRLTEFSFNLEYEMKKTWFAVKTLLTV